MYYYCSKLNAFALPRQAARVPAGSIIAASAVPSHQLLRRKMAIYQHMQHRLFDPQLYLAGLDPRTCRSMCFKLATYSWFRVDAPEYDSEEHSSLNEYKERFIDEILRQWPSVAPTADDEIEESVRACLEFQSLIGCESFIIPSPLTLDPRSYDLELRYIDAGIAAADELELAQPLYATVAISDGLLRNLDPFQNPLVETISDCITARAEIAGAYIVADQVADTGYVCVNENVIGCMLVLANDLSQGAGKHCIVNYLGPLGAVISAAGARIWTSGYYRSQRRMRLADQEEDPGRAYPRFFSRALAGDIGLENDLPLIQDAGMLSRVFTRTAASNQLYHAIVEGRYPTAAPEWEYRVGQIWAAAAHYNDACCRMETYFDSTDGSGRVEYVQRWLECASVLAEDIAALGITNQHSDIRHQSIWRTAFENWRRRTGN